MNLFLKSIFFIFLSNITCFAYSYDCSEDSNQNFSDYFNYSCNRILVSQHNDGKNYARIISSLIKSNILFKITDLNSTGNPTVEIVFYLDEYGHLEKDPTIVKSSGLVEWDMSVVEAIRKSSPFPPDVNGKIPHKFIIVHRMF